MEYVKPRIEIFEFERDNVIRTSLSNIGATTGNNGEIIIPGDEIGEWQ